MGPQYVVLMTDTWNDSLKSGINVSHALESQLVPLALDVLDLLLDALLQPLHFLKELVPVTLELGLLRTEAVKLRFDRRSTIVGCRRLRKGDTGTDSLLQYIKS